MWKVIRYVISILERINPKPKYLSRVNDGQIIPVRNTVGRV